MAATSRAEARWEGDLVKGSGHVKPASEAFAELPITWAARAEHQHGTTSPEELIAAAHASCYCMAFSNGPSKAGHEVERLDTTAEVDLVPGTRITQIRLRARGGVAPCREGSAGMQTSARRRPQRPRRLRACRPGSRPRPPSAGR